MTSQIRKQIQEWIRTDARCVALEAELTALKRKQLQCWSQFRARQQAEHWGLFRQVRGVDDFRVAIVDRRKRVQQMAKAHPRLLAKQSAELRRNLARLENQRIRVAHALGARRGFLRKDFADRFVKLAAKELARQTRRGKVCHGV